MLQEPAGSPESETDVVKKFMTSLWELRVTAFQARTEAEAAEVVRKILLSKEAKSVVAAGIPEGYRRALGANAVFLEDLQGRPAPEVVDVIARADVGITWASYGVARQGALVEVAYDDSVKLVSSLPVANVVLVEASSVLPELGDAMLEVGRLIRESPRNRKPVVSFISGPSKTGDIEMRALYGVHGPHSVFAVVLDLPGGRPR
jgi:L-lactate dehydrogenase complex protein LldG